MAYLVGYQADIYVTSGAAVPFTDEAMTGNAERTVYTINDAAKRFWDRSTAVVVEQDTAGVPPWNVVDPSEYEVYYAGGQIIFKVARVAGTQVRVDGAYLAYSQLAQAHEWSLEYQRAQVDVTCFGDSWDKYSPVTGNGRLSMTRWWYDQFFHTEIGTLLGFKLMPNSSGTAAFYAFGRLTGGATAMRVKDILSENPSFQVHGNIAYIA